MSAHSSDTSWVLELGVSMALAGGLIEAFRRLRRRRSSRGVARSRALRRLELAEGLLGRVAQVSFTQWAQEALHRAALFAAERQLVGAPVALEMSPEDGVELLWDAPQAQCPPPWSAIDGGWSWHAPFDEDAWVDAADLPVAVPALVTIGRRDGRDLLVDLEAFGMVTVTGDPIAAGNLVRSVALELASGELLSNAYLVTVGIDLTIADHLERLTACSEDEAISRLLTTVEDNRRVMERADAPTTFRLRGAPPFGREVTIFVVNASSCSRLEDLLAHATPRSGIGVVLLAGQALSPAAINVISAEAANLPLLGLDFEPAGVSAEIAEVIERGLDQLEGEEADGQDFAAAAPDDPEAAAAPDPDETEPLRISQLDVDWGQSEEPLEPRPAPSVLIRVLGTPRVEHPADLRPLDVSLLSFIVCRGGAAPDEQVIDAVWGGRAVSRPTVYNRLSKIRLALGGCIEVRDKSDTSMRLAEGVTTDLQLMADLIRQAQSESSVKEIALLREALDWIEGPPFDAAGYEWAFTFQDHAEACELIETTCLRLIDLALDARDTSLARQAASAGLKALRLNEPIYRARMRIEASIGNLAGVRSVYSELASLLHELDGYEPSPETREALRTFTRPLSA